MRHGKKTGFSVRTDMKAGGWWDSVKEQGNDALGKVKQETSGAWTSVKGWVKKNMEPIS